MPETTAYCLRAPAGKSCFLLVARKQEGRGGLVRDETHPPEVPDTLGGTPFLQPSDSLVSCVLRLTSPREEARALVPRQPGPHSQYRSIWGFPGTGVTAGWECPVCVLGTELSPLGEQQVLLSTGLPVGCCSGFLQWTKVSGFLSYFLHKLNNYISYFPVLIKYPAEAGSDRKA